MCGIVGITGKAGAAEVALNSLQRLEYRGYDSAGIATLDNGTIHITKSEGKIKLLAEKVKTTPPPGSIAIGHTRWATHGSPSTANAHPHQSKRVVVVHNGIIENHEAIRSFLAQSNIDYRSETDTEVIPHLIEYYLDQGSTASEALLAAINQLEGAYALAIMVSDQPDTLYAARKGSPLAVGHGDGYHMIGSDAMALSGFCKTITYLLENDIAIITPGHVEYVTSAGEAVSRGAQPIAEEFVHEGKGSYAHFMLKEIHQQPGVIARTLQHFYDGDHHRFALPPELQQDGGLTGITIVACGTSYYAAQIAGYWLEQIAFIPTRVEIASEFRYRKPVLLRGGLSIFISQSGETADTLAALRYCKHQGQKTLALVNVPQSSLAREADNVMLTQAGQEIGVASTKAFTTQIAALACITIALAPSGSNLHVHELGSVVGLVEQTLASSKEIEEVAKTLTDAQDMLFIGRGTAFPVACEGALKMKEISYIHAEGYAAGELKHGPLALIDESVPVIVVAPDDELFEKTASNLQEVASRGGRIILISTQERIDALRPHIRHGIAIAKCSPLSAPIAYTIPMQLLAYYVAVLKGNDVDQPRNLAKSVTVE